MRVQEVLPTAAGVRGRVHDAIRADVDDGRPGWNPAEDVPGPRLAPPALPTPHAPLRRLCASLESATVHVFSSVL